MSGGGGLPAWEDRVRVRKSGCLVYSLRDDVVPGTGLEPARLAALDPKSSASANSAIPANNYVIETIEESIS
jgi:hypothetical protein